VRTEPYRGVFGTSIALVCWHFRAVSASSAGKRQKRACAWRFFKDNAVLLQVAADYLRADWVEG
jgi:hypothetical protein